MGWKKRNVSNIILNLYYIKRKAIYIYKKSQKITPVFLNKWVYIYNGRRFFRRYIYKKYLGYLMGELVWTRKPAKYKNKKKMKMRKRSKKTERKQTKNPLKRYKKKMFKIKRKQLKLEKKEKLIELNPLLKPRKASQKLIPDTVFKILKLFK